MTRLPQTLLKTNLGLSRELLVFWICRMYLGLRTTVNAWRMELAVCQVLNWFWARALTICGPSERRGAYRSLWVVYSPQSCRGQLQPCGLVRRFVSQHGRRTLLKGGEICDAFCEVVCHMLVCVWHVCLKTCWGKVFWMRGRLLLCCVIYIYICWTANNTRMCKRWHRERVFLCEFCKMVDDFTAMQLHAHANIIVLWLVRFMNWGSVIA